MIETIINIAKLLLAILPLLLLCRASNKANLPKSERSRQFAMPVITLIYVITAMLLMDRINNWLLTLLNNIPKWISALAGVSWMPDTIGNFINKIGSFFESILHALNMNFWIFFISNIVIIFVYVIFKKICTGIISASVKSDGRFHTKIAGKFYEFFSEKNKWCLKESYVQVRNLLKVFYYAAIWLSVILMIVSRYFYFHGLMKSVFYPVFGILVVGELYFYLNGATKIEYAKDILGEDEDAYRIVNYSLLRKFLRSIFGDKLLAENTSINNALSYDLTTDDIIRELEKSEDQKIVSFAAYIDALNRTGFKIDHNYLYSSLDMLGGKSILFNNPFYNDLIPYAFYPMNRTLLSHQKVLVVLGRHSIEDDIIEWLERGIEAVTNIPFLWNIGILNSEPQNLDIGIITRSDVLDIKLHDVNSEFLENVGFVVIIEPSKLISTAQIGLNLIAKKCRSNEDKNIVYCMCDKNCDGLVDAMSHVLMTSITEVSATEKHLGTSSYMCWEADNDYLHHRLVPNISRYLGLGTELSFAALKNQVSKTKWYGGEAFPVTDIRWIDRQYYYDLTKYASIATSQESMDEHFITSFNFWSADVEKNNYFTVEDEAYNMFEILRDFSTRTTEQGFINVISSEYLLKDYMADNASIFEADAKAIPYIVADYTRSNRNTILKLILMISTFPVSAEVLEKELSLIGISVFDLKKQLWYELYKCYVDVSEIAKLPDNYEEAVQNVYLQKLPIDSEEITHDIIKVEDTFNLKIGKMETTYSIVDPVFLSICVSELKSAGYVAEDEKGQRYYLGSELNGHIFQKYLPGQFFTFGGKYYEMQHLTADGQILVRRAADHITGRPAYRQVREYTIHGVKPSDKIGAQQNIAGLKVVKEFADISVMTSGYYHMNRYNDFNTARCVLFEGEEKNGIPKRVYHNKEILRIELPDFNGKLNNNIRYTVTVLFNEIFKTLFAENQAYICAVTDDTFLKDTSDTKPLTYSLTGDGYELQKNAIYIIEDSQLDLGLTVAVERNLQRIFSIMHDYIDWHIEALEVSLNPPPEPQPPIVFTDPENAEEPKKKGVFKRFFSAIGRGIKKVFGKIRNLFKRKPKKDKEPTDEEVPSGEEIPTGGEVPAEGVTPETENTPIGGEIPAEGETPASGDPSVERETPIDDEIPVGGDIPTEGVTPSSEGKPAETEANSDNGEKEVTTSKKKHEKKGIFGWFRRRKRKREAAEEPVENESAEPGPEASTDDTDNSAAVEETAESTSEAKNEAAGTASDDADSEEGKGETPIDMTEAPLYEETSDSPENQNEDQNNIGFFAARKPYHERYYMLYGNESELPFIDLTGTLDYLSEMGMLHNPLKQARECKNIAELVEATFKPGKPDARYCDFCGAEIYGVEYETLADGRDRCLSCGKTAIKTEEEFRKIFEDVKRNMESFFGIRINAGIKVEMVNARTLHKRLGKAFIPTPKADGRVLGVAISDKDGYKLMVENSSPRMASMLTMAHELTHIWQYINWKDKAIRKKYGKKMRLEIYEGMAKWVEIQYAYLINEPAVAKREEIITSYRDDEYGHGFLRYRANYPFSFGTVITKKTPFLNVSEPLDPEFCGPFTVIMPTNGINPGDVNGEHPSPTGENNPRTGGVSGALKGPIQRNPEMLNRYAYGLLSDDEKSVYNTVLEAIMNFTNEITVFNASVTDTQIKKIVDYIQRDHPEIFWFRHGATFYYDTETHIVNRLELKYCMSPDERSKRQDEIDASLKPFLSSIHDDMSDYEVTLRIYENIIKLVDYDTIGSEKQKKTHVSPDTPDDLRSIYGVFVNKKAVCAGYSKATQYLLNLYGIECSYVTSDTHAWNLIKLEGDYYHLDTTWGDSSDTKKEKSQPERISYDCFCITTEELSRLDSHTPEEDFPLPKCTATKCNYYRRFGLYFDKFDCDKIRTIVCESIKMNKFDISFKFSSSKVFTEAKKQLVDNGKFREIIQYSNLKSGVRINSSYMYSASKDKLTIAFFMTKL